MSNGFGRPFNITVLYPQMSDRNFVVIDCQTHGSCSGNIKPIEPLGCAKVLGRNQGDNGTIISNIWCRLGRHAIGMVSMKYHQVACLCHEKMWILPYPANLIISASDSLNMPSCS